MAYAQFWSQLYHMLHYLFAFVLLMVLFPRLLFFKVTSDPLEQLFANFLRMIFLLIVLGYVLVSTKLFEFLSITTIIGLLIMNRFAVRQPVEERMEQQNRLIIWIYDYFEGLIQMKQVFTEWWRGAKQSLLAEGRKLLSSVPRMLTLVLLLTVVTTSAYIRFYDAFTSPVPGMSDGNVTLKWMKFIDSRQLFPDGFYPEGFHIILDTLFKYADIDPIYILKYTGPLNTVLVELGFYFVVTRITGNKLSGIAAMIVHGLLSPLFAGTSYERQASTNSQEFAFVFILPSLYFYSVYLRTGMKYALWAAAAGTCVVGLVHEVGFVWLGIGMGILLCCHIILNGIKKHAKRLVVTCTAGVGAVLVTAIPFLMAKLFKVKDHSNTATYAVNRLPEIHSPLLDTIDYAALIAVFIVLLYALLMKADRLAKLPYLFISCFVLATFLIYYYGGPLTHLEVIGSRSLDLWILCIPVILGIAWHSIFQIISKLQFKGIIELGVSIVVLIGVVVLVPIQPIIPYKMESATAVEQYLRIADEYDPMQFMIVSPRVQEYGIVLGSGVHMYLAEDDPHLLGVYDPKKVPLTRIGEDKHALLPKDIFIYYEKNIYKVNETNSVYQIEKPNYARYEKQYAELQVWIQAYKEAHPSDGSFSIFYEDKDFIIYHLHRDETRDEVIRKIWN